MPRPRGRPRKNDSTSNRSKAIPAGAGRPRGRPRKENNSYTSFQPATIKGIVDIYWIGHSSFRIHSVNNGKSIITDPYVISKKRVDTISAFTVSHFDDHHNNIPEYASGIRVFKSPGEYEYDGFTIRSVMSPLSSDMTRDRRNVVYNISIDGFSICHMGNISEPLTPQNIDMIGQVDVILAPHDDDDNNLLSYYEILKIARYVDAKIIVPMHYTKDHLPTRFLNDAGMSKNKLDIRNKLRLSINNMPQSLHIELLDPQVNESQSKLHVAKEQNIVTRQRRIEHRRGSNKLASIFRFKRT